MCNTSFFISLVPVDRIPNLHIGNEDYPTVKDKISSSRGKIFDYEIYTSIIFHFHFFIVRNILLNEHIILKISRVWCVKTVVIYKSQCIKQFFYCWGPLVGLGLFLLRLIKSLHYLNVARMMVPENFAFQIYKFINCAINSAADNKNDKNKNFKYLNSLHYNIKHFIPKFMYKIAD